MGIDTRYITSSFGILKILEFISLLIGWACLVDITNGRYYRNSRQRFYIGVSITAWVVVILWFLGYVLGFCGQINFSQKNLVFMLIHVLFFVLLLVCSSLIADDAASICNACGGRWKSLCEDTCNYHAVAAAFGLFAALLFLIDAYYHWKGSPTTVGQAGGGGGGGTRVVKTKTTTVTTTKR